MVTRWRRLHRDERGMSYVFVSVGFLSFCVATTLAIDVGMLMTARTQAQTSADAGALAGATALVFNSYSDHSSTSPAVKSAMNTAGANSVMGEVPSVKPSDVTFPLDATTGAYDQVQVTVYRTQERSNPVGTLIARYFGTPTVDVTATAIAAAWPANQLDCVLPFTIPDKWAEHQCGTATCPWTGSYTFDMFASQGNHQNVGAPLPNPDVYVPPGQPGSTGYSANTDIGMQLILKPNSQSEVTPSFYNAWDIGGITGANAFGNNISGCNSIYTTIGQDMVPETGNMVGPTKQGTQALIDSDPNAQWDPTCNGGIGCITGSAFHTSPRIRPVPLYDPIAYAMDQHSGKSWPQLTLVNYLGFFIESVDNGGTVTGRIYPIVGQFKSGLPLATGGFAQAIILSR